MNNTLVSVVTLTHARPEALLRACASVAAQQDVDVEHIIIGDDAGYLNDPDYVRRLSRQHGRTIVKNVPREAGHADEYLSARVGRLRNLGIDLAGGEFVAQLDDDNAYDPEHLSSLVTLLRDNPAAEVAHSWRRLVDKNGASYVPDLVDPWHPFPAHRAASYESLEAAGVFERGSSVVRDRLWAGDRLIGRIDTSEFLVRRAFHAEMRFAETFSAARRKLQWSEDYAFAIELARRKVDVVCSHRPTVIYTMGGYSNVETA
ncbi:glycosyltransferase [Nonomuraea sp. NPDC005650]|uniref:glycosyltransferase family 2 protein n=1 Tax=Nonomuraea sp. NPDC005650 TaxID=3157045 RepID=UPI0033A01EF9